MIYYVYIYLNEDWEVCYVGKGKGNRIDRGGGRSYFPPPERRIKVYEDLTEERALEIEAKLIEIYGKENLLNKTTGGQGISGLVFTEEQRKKMSKSQRKVNRNGENNPYYGKKHSEEVREKMREAAKNRGEEWKDRQRKSRTKGQVYYFINPEGERVKVEGSLNYFCINRGLNTGGMCQVHKGNRPHHKQWRKG